VGRLGFRVGVSASYSYFHLSRNKCAECALSRRVPGTNRKPFRLIYKTYIRPHLEFCIQAWSPHFVKDMEVLENVQRAATNLVSGLRKYSYPIRLQKIGITSLRERRVRGDRIEVHKLLIGKEQVDYKQFLPREAMRSAVLP